MSTIDSEIFFTQEFLQFLLKLRFPNGKNPYVQHVNELLEIGETDQAIIVLSEILRGPRFSNKVDFWMERIKFWIDSKLEHDPDAFGGTKLLPYRVFYNLTNIIALDSELLRCILDPPMLK
jgi:hypothetical protein